MQNEKTVFERSVKGRKGHSLDLSEVSGKSASDFLPAHLVRQKEFRLPELTELDVVQHYTRLSQQNYSIDTHFYPLGSCTMKYNPRVNEDMADLDGFACVHPMQYQFTVQGNLKLMHELGEMLKAVTGMDAVTLQPAAGAHGEFTGILMIRAYHTARGNPRKKIIIPDSAHGTNPSSAHIAGYEVVTIKTGADGLMSPESVAEVMDEDVAALMLTNPSTLGVFESHIQEISKIVHDKGGLVYCDGANLNAVMGKVRMGDLGVDCMHINLHKTFTTPHGGGGPGSGPVVIKKCLEPHLPVPVLQKLDKRYHFDFKRPETIGRVRGFFGNFGMFVRAYTYMREMGPEGLKRVSELAVLNANYVRAKLKDHFTLGYDAPSMHEVVFSEKGLTPLGVKTLDLGKRILDYGFHTPTVYFPTIVKGALMIEPTETTSKETLDDFCDAMIKIVEEAKENPETLKTAPHKTFRRRLDEVRAVKELKLREHF
jgi:glycine dehydrogenase subunit 2